MSNFELFESVERSQCQNAKCNNSGHQIELGYWNIRGLGNHCRLLLEYLCVPYSDRRYNIKQNDDGTFNSDSYRPYREHKENRKEEFPFIINLPYLVHQGEQGTMYEEKTHLIQTKAILFYIAKVFGTPATLGGESARAQAQHMRLVESCADLGNSCVGAYYSTPLAEFETKVKDLATNNAERYISDFLAQKGNKKFLFFNHDLTVADIASYEVFDTLRLANGGKVDFPQGILDFLSAFEAVPEIKSYMSSPDFIRFQCNNKTACHTGNYESICK